MFAQVGVYHISAQGVSGGGSMGFGGLKDTTLGKTGLEAFLVNPTDARGSGNITLNGIQWSDKGLDAQISGTVNASLDTQVHLRVLDVVDVAGQTQFEGTIPGFSLHVNLAPVFINSGGITAIALVPTVEEKTVDFDILTQNEIHFDGGWATLPASARLGVRGHRSLLDKDPPAWGILAKRNYIQSLETPENDKSGRTWNIQYPSGIEIITVTPTSIEASKSGLLIGADLDFSAAGNAPTSAQVDQANKENDANSDALNKIYASYSDNRPWHNHMDEWELEIGQGDLVLGSNNDIAKFLGTVYADAKNLSDATRDQVAKRIDDLKATSGQASDAVRDGVAHVVDQIGSVLGGLFGGGSPNRDRNGKIILDRSELQRGGRGPVR
jgi:hypothetical protein